MLKPTTKPSNEPVTPSTSRYGMGRLVGRLITFWQTNREPILLWGGWRIALVLLPIFIGVLIPKASADPPSPQVWQERLVGGWTRWDGSWYVRLALDGYNIGENTPAFYPLYPHLIRWVAFVLTFGHVTEFTVSVAGIIVSSLAALATCVLLYRLARQEYDGETARLSVLYLLAFPVAFFLCATFTEAVFMAVAVGAFYAARNRHWLIAMLLAGLAVLTKNQGVFVPVALAFEYGQQIGWQWRKLNRVVAYFLLPVVAFGGWLLFNAVAFGNPTAFVAANEKWWDRHFAWPWDTLLRAGRDFFKVKDGGTWLPLGDAKDNLDFVNFPMTMAFVVLLGLAIWATLRGWLRPAYLIYFALCLVQPLTSPNGGSTLLAIPRYLLILFPAFMLLALLGRKFRLLHYTYLALCWPLLGLLLARFVLSYWVA